MMNETTYRVQGHTRLRKPPMYFFKYKVRQTLNTSPSDSGQTAYDNSQTSPFIRHRCQAPTVIGQSHARTQRSTAATTSRTQRSVPGAPLKRHRQDTVQPAVGQPGTPSAQTAATLRYVAVQFPGAPPTVSLKRRRNPGAHTGGSPSLRQSEETHRRRTATSKGHAYQTGPLYLFKYRPRPPGEADGTQHQATIQFWPIVH